MEKEAAAFSTTSFGTNKKQKKKNCEFREYDESVEFQ